MKTLQYDKRTLYILYLTIGVFIYTLGRCSLIYFNNEFVANAIIIIGILVSFYSIIVSRCKLYEPFDDPLSRNIYYLLIMWVVIIIIRSFMANPINNVIAIKAAYALLGFLTPFIPFLGIKNLNIKAVFKLCLVASCIAIMYTLWNFREIYLTPHIEIMLGELDLAEQVAEGAKGQVAGYFVLPACLLLMSYRFVPPAYIKIVTIAFILSILSAVAYGRRTAIVYHIVYGLAALYLYLTSKKTRLYKKITITVSIFIIIYVIILNISDIPLFEFLIERMDPDKFDTRSGVEEFFYNDFVGKIFDWLFGRGIGGTYYCPSGDALYRTVIETGYLQFILNGGIILLGLFLIICLRSFYLGFFKSDNMLNKAMSLFILIQLVFLKGGNPFEFSFRAVLLWVCIVFCNSAKYRHLSNNQIRKIVK